MSGIFRICRIARPFVAKNVQCRHRTIQSHLPDEKTDYMKWFLLAMPVTSFALGVWQVRRREWKLNLIKTLEERTTSEPVDIPEDLWEVSTLEYCPVRVKGHFLHDREILMGPRGLLQDGGKDQSGGSLMTNPNKNQGWIVITPFQLSGRREIILINRGWVRKDQKDPAQRLPGQIPYEIELVGNVRHTEVRPQFMPKNIPSKGVWYYKDLDEMAKMTGSAPILLDAKGTTDMPPGWPIPNQTKINFRNEHLSYIVTWFGLSAFTTFMWVRRYVYKLR